MENDMFEYEYNNGGVVITNYIDFATDVEIPAEIDGKPVTTIGRWAFVGCYSLRSIIIPEGVTTIGESAFWGCSALEFVFLPDSVTTIGNGAFADCESLESIDIPQGVTTIGDKTFAGCWFLEFIAIPDSVTTIGKEAFSWCLSLESIAIPAGVTTIGDSAFKGCESLKTWKVAPDNVNFKSIGESLLSKDGKTFITCPAATGDFHVPEGVTTIAKGAFWRREDLQSIFLPSSVTTIGDEAFRCCKGLKSIFLPSSVTAIGDGAFRCCKTLKTWQVSPDNPNFKSEGESLLSKDGKTFIACPVASGTFHIPDSVTKIGIGAFWGCSSLESLVLPDSVTTIGKEAFSGCKPLKSITIPSSVTMIGDRAFMGCSNLTIRAPKGSRAEKYTRRYSQIKFEESPLTK